MGDKTKKIILLGGIFNQNMGVCALTSGAIKSIWQVCPDARISLLDFNSVPLSYRLEHPHGNGLVQLINLRFSKKIWLRNHIVRLIFTALIIRAIPTRSLRDKFYSRNPLFSQIKVATLVGSIAGGDSFSDIYGIRRLIYVALPQILVLIMGKSLVILPQTVGPFKSLVGKIIASFILKRANKIYFRDKEGNHKIHDFLKGLKGRTAFSYDMGFVLEPRIAKERIPGWLLELEPNTPVVGINISGLLYIGGYTGKNMFGLKGDYRNAIHALIMLFVQKYNAHIMLVPHVLGNVKNSESDVIACRNIYSETLPAIIDRLHVVDDGYDQHELKALIGRCDFFIGARMHACIAALSQCIPAVGMAYSKKFRGVFKSVDMQDLVLDLRDYNEDAIVEITDRLYRRRSEFRKQLNAKMPEVNSSVLSLFAGFQNTSNQ